MKKTRAHVIINGRVQGVCFRMETRRAALKRGVTGWVRNRSDYTVEAVFEGEEPDVRSMLKWCDVGPRLARVSEVSLSWKPYTGEFVSFDITFV
ncbi:MAG: acylphosphatase [Desulfobacterales bacterium S5133MH4]|nr:MAG: acylphosphatase [Desulfobacterales bacterium S5133MH4]